MRTLIDPNMMPPTGYFFIDPNSGFKTETASLSTLIKISKQHRVANGYPIPTNWAAIVEDFICLNNDPDFSKGEADRKFNVPLTESWIRAAMDEQYHLWRRSGGRFVQQLKANQRAEICLHCQNNVRSPICFSCVGLDTLQRSAFERTTPVDSDLRVCKMIAVPAESLVHIPGDSLMKVNRELPDHCWYKAELEQQELEDGN